MTGRQPEYPWWARSTGGNRGFAPVLAVTYTLLFAVEAVAWFTKSDGWFGLLAIGSLLLAVWAWATVVYLHRRSESIGGRRGW